MGKAANRKRNRNLDANCVAIQAIRKAQSGFVDDSVIVEQVMTAIENNCLIAFQAAVKLLEASGSDLFHFEIKLFEDDDQSTDMSLLHYAIYMAVEDIVAWIIRRGIEVGDEESLSELQVMMEVLNFGGNGTEDIALFQRLCLKALRPHTIDQAKGMVRNANAALQVPGTPKPCLMLMIQAANDYLTSQASDPHQSAHTDGHSAALV
jgi:hypothetical protein